MTKRQNYAALKMRELRESRKAAGLCPGCGQTHDRPDKYYCSSCGERSNRYSSEWKAERRQARICPRCGRALDREGATCSVCTEKVTQAVRMIKQHYAGQGLCERCGQNPPKAGAKWCTECARRAHLRRVAQRSKKGLAAQQVQQA